MKGYNACIFAYGQTGSGKTHTILGGDAHSSEGFDVGSSQSGLLPRVLSYLFEHISRTNLQRSEDTQTLCQCSFLEIYNEQIFDLLDSAPNNLQVVRRPPAHPPIPTTSGLSADSHAMHGNSAGAKLMCLGSSRVLSVLASSART